MATVYSYENKCETNYTITNKTGTTRTPSGRPQSSTPMTTLTQYAPALQRSRGVHALSLHTHLSTALMIVSHSLMAQVLSEFHSHLLSIHGALSLTRLSTFYFFLFLLSVPVFLFHLELFPELPHTKCMANLCHSANKESEDAYDVFHPPTSYEPNLLAFDELYDSSVPSPSWSLPRTKTWMTWHSASCSQRHTEVSRRLLCSMDQGNLMENEWSMDQGNLMSHLAWFKLTTIFVKTSEWSKLTIDQGNLMSVTARMHRLGLYLKSKDRRLSRNIAKKSVITNSKQLTLKKSANSYKDSMATEKEFREARQQSLTEMNNYGNSRVLPSILLRDENSARIRTLFWNYQAEYRNCMNDSKDFQDAESVRSGNSHVTSRPVSFPPHPIPGWMLRHSFVSPSRREGPPSIWDTHGKSGNVFCKSRCVFISTFSPRIASMEFVNRRAAPFAHSGEKWKARTKSRSEMPVWTVSHRFSHLQWRRLFKLLWCRPTTTADFGSSLWHVPYTSFVCLLEDKVQDRGMYLFAISCGSDAMDQRSGDGWFSGWYKIFVINTRYFSAEFRSARCEDGFSTDPNHPEHPLQKKGHSGGRKGQKEDFFLRGRQIAYLIYDYFRVTWIYDSVENYADLFTMSLRNDDIQEFDSKWDGILLSMTKIPPDDILEGLYKLRIRESEKLKTVLELYDLEIHQKKLGPDYHRLKTMVKRSIEQDIRKSWEERRGQESGNKTACTKNYWGLLAMGNQRAVCERRQLQFPPRYR